jgi:hypothetical protein
MPENGEGGKRAVPQNEAGAPENRIVVLRTRPDAPSRTSTRYLDPWSPLEPVPYHFSSGNDTYGALKVSLVPAIGPGLCTIICYLPNTG